MLMALATLAGASASCQNNNNGRDETTSSNVETPESNTETQEGSTEAQGSESEESTGEETEPPVVNDNKIANKNDPIIELAASTANGVQAYFTDAGRTHYSIVNSEMTMNYARSNTSAQLVESIKNTNGVAYIQNTMDVFPI